MADEVRDESTGDAVVHDQVGPESEPERAQDLEPGEAMPDASGEPGERPLSERVPEVNAPVTPPDVPAQPPEAPAEASETEDAQVAEEPAVEEEPLAQDAVSAEVEDSSSSEGGPAQSEAVAEASAADAVSSAEVPTEVPVPVVIADSSGTVPLWPFLAYDALWLVFAGVLGWLAYSAPSETAVFETTYYPLVILAGIVLTLAGPALVFVLWSSMKRSHPEGSPLLVPLLLRGALATLVGVTIWWIVLIVADAVRLGRLL